MWALLQAALDVPRERPADSVTAEELAAKAGVSYDRARQILRANAGLKSVEYRRANGRRAVCYVRAS